VNPRPTTAIDAIADAYTQRLAELDPIGATYMAVSYTHLTLPTN
jgi:hypothetical protein